MRTSSKFSTRYEVTAKTVYLNMVQRDEQLILGIRTQRKNSLQRQNNHFPESAMVVFKSKMC